MRNSLGTIMVCVCAVLTLAIGEAYGQAQSTYDFSTNAGVDRFAFGASVPATPLPPTANTVPTTELLTAEYTAISVSDDSRYSTGLAGTTDRPATRFTFTIAESPSTVTQLNVRWEGGATTGGESATVFVWIWNASASLYSVVGTTQAEAPPDAVVSYTFSTSPTVYIDGSNTVTLLVAANKGDKGILTDYVRLVVTYQECWSDPECDDVNVCTDDTCVGGFCQYANNTAACDDEDPCTVSDSCSGGACQSGSPPDCSGAGDQCNTASCDTGGTEGNCDVLTPVTNGTPCDDGLPCTDGECQVGTCVFADYAGQVTVDVEVAAVGSAVTRDVTFVITTCGGATDTRVVSASIDEFGLATAVINNVDADAAWISAREGHTLRRLSPLSFTACAATVDMTNVDGLLSGDFHTGVVTQDNLVDITDFSILAAAWNTSIDASLSTGADATGDGVQGTADFTAIQVSFLTVGDAADACPVRANGPSVVRVDSLPADVWLLPQDSVPVADLMIAGADEADVNGDGFVDVADIHAFAAMHDLPLLPEFSRRTMVPESTKSSRGHRARETD